MKRTASEVIRNLEMRIARLERQASNRTARSEISVMSGEGSPSNHRHSFMTVQELLSMVKSQHNGDSLANIDPKGSRSTVDFYTGGWSASVDMYEFINAIEADHPKEMQALMSNANVMDDGDADAMASAVQDYLKTSRGSFGGGLGRGWMVKVNYFI